MGQAVAGQGTGGSHIWRFFRAGGFDQVRLDSGADIAALDKLDQKLWVALSCPTRGLEFDSRTLDLIDTDHDGRIRVPEIIAAAKWACANLKNPDDLVKGGDALPLAAIDDSTPEGKQLLASARRILSNLGKGDAKAITIADTMDTAKIFAQTNFNGDGVVPPEAADEAATRAIVADIIACLGGEADRSGKVGVNQAKVDQFYAELAAYAAWRQKAEEAASDIFPLGEGTAAAFDALRAVRAKVDDYFARCRLVAFDARAAGALNRAEADFAALAAKDLSASGDEVASFPLAKAEAGKPLPLGEGVNPAWTGAVARLNSLVVAPLLGANKASLTAEEWAALKAKFVPYEAWLGAKAGAAVEKLGLPRVRELLAGNGKEALTALIAQDRALEPEVNAINAVERLARYYRDLYQLLNNFVSFADFYSRKRKAVFQAGTLYLDGRSCDLCVRVEDAGKHAALAVLSKTYLAYCDCTRKGTPEKMTIAAAFTGGDSDNLMVGRNGVFYDRQGRDWDATITKITEQPISIRQAILSPYKRIGRMIGEQIEKIASARDKTITDKAAGGIEAAAQKVDAPKPAAPPPAFDIAKFAGIFAAIGLAIGAIGGVLAAVASGFLSLTWWQMPLAILGVFIVVSGPSVIIAWLKLRKRNLGPILDANGWAVNALVKINIPFGGALTKVAKLPPGSERSLADPYAQKSAARWLVPLLVVAALIAGVAIWYFGYHRPAQEKPAPAVEAPKEPAPAPK